MFLYLVVYLNYENNFHNVKRTGLDKNLDMCAQNPYFS